MFGCSWGAPAFPQAAGCGSSQPSLGKYRNSSVTQFFSALPDLFILGAFPRNLCWTDVVQIQVSYFFSWDYCTHFFSGKDLCYHDPDSTKLLIIQHYWLISHWSLGVSMASSGCVEELPLVGNNLCINSKVNTEDVWVSFPLSRPE